MENNTQQSKDTAQLSLFKKLMQKLTSPCHNRNNKIVRRLAALAVACGIALAPLSACDFGTNTPGTNPGGITPGQTNNPSDNSEYSTLLQSVLDDSYYRSLAEQAKENPYILKEAYFAPHPYSFLKEEGHDIDKIKKGELFAKTLTYTYDDEPTNLYMATYVENPGNFYTEYLLRYELTKQEMQEYEMLHGYEGGQRYYIQSAFINDAISKTKEVEVLAQNNVHIDAHKKIKEVFNKEIKDTTIRTDFDILFLNINTETNRFDILCIPTGDNHLFMIFKDKMGIAKMKGTIIMENSVFIGPRAYPSFSATEKISTTQIKLYNCQDASLTSNYAQDLYE